MSSDRFGTSVASAGDVNNDGLADLIVGAPGNGMMAAGPGSAIVFRSNGVGYTEMQSHRMDGVLGGLFGNSVAGAGDVDGDGFGEVIVGAPEENMLRGQALVFRGMMSGTNPMMPLILNGGMAVSEQFGRSVAWLGLGTWRSRTRITFQL